MSYAVYSFHNISVSLSIQDMKMKQELKEIKIDITPTSRLSQVDWNKLPFGQIFSDHMLVMDFKDGAWQEPEIVPFDSISLHPATSALHYGQSIFEGMKAYRQQDGNIALFRPEMNARRFMQSCERLCMPTMDEELFIELIKRLVEVDKEWVPRTEGSAMYLRPFIFATDEMIGIKPSDTYKFMIFTCPVGAYYSQPVRVKIEEQYTRAASGGVGAAKTAGNYAASLYPAKQGQMQGFHQLVWTDAKEHKYIEESGTMNICFVINDVLITPSEESDTILKGTTKRAVIDVAKSWGIKVEERKVAVAEIIEAAQNGLLQEAFGAGTAATIANIEAIGYRDEILNLPAFSEDMLSVRIKRELDGIKDGSIADQNGWIVTI